MRMIKSKPNELPFVYWMNHRPEDPAAFSTRRKSFFVGKMENGKENLHIPSKNID